MYFNTSGVYSITHKATGKRYVGSSRNVKNRWHRHVHHLRHGTHWIKALQDDWNRDGGDSFSLEVLEEVKDISMLKEREQAWLEKLKVVESGYNISPTADSPLGVMRSEETRKRISRVQKGRKASAETRAKMSLAHKGKVCSDETRRRISKALLGNQNAQGEKAGAAKLTEENVREILWRLRNGEAQTKIARDFGVTQAAISAIKRGINWAHVKFE